MNYPYTTQPVDALMSAQTSVGLVLGAIVWAKRVRPWISTALFLVAVALAIAAPVEGDFLRGFDVALRPEHAKNLLKLAAAMATLGALGTRQLRVAVAAALGEAALWPITNYIQNCDSDLAAAHLVFFGLLVGMLRTDGWPVLHAGAKSRDEDPTIDELHRSLRRSFWREDAALFGAATLASTLVCWLVLKGRTNSGDEWAYTFQAALFAKLHAYAAVPHCSEALRSFWVFQYMGRSFAQYTPGWSYFMTPFVAMRVPWFAGPASLGLLTVGTARLARRAVSGFTSQSRVPSLAHVRVAGRFATLVLVLSSTVLINGASRYPHVFVGALFAWALEALCVVATPPLPPAAQRRWGAVLGVTAALVIATRPADGATLGIGLFLYFVYATVRRRIGWQAVATTAVAAAAVAGVTLIVLRLQLGVWLKTGYSLNEVIYPWAKVAWSLPKPNEYRWGIPLAAGSYCWWPCSPAVGVAGIASLAGRARRIGFVFFFGTIPFVTLYTLSELGRGFDLGYGPRYALPLVVPMAVGTGVVLAYLWSVASVATDAKLEALADAAIKVRAPEMSFLTAGGPATIAFTAIGVGVLRIAPLVYPHHYADVHQHNRLHEAIDRMAIHDAVVFGGSGLNSTDPMDLTENLPLDLYPNQDVIIAIDRGSEQTRCVKELYGGRSFYRAIPGDPVRLVPY